MIGAGVFSSTKSCIDRLRIGLGTFCSDDWVAGPHLFVSLLLSNLSTSIGLAVSFQNN